MKAGSTRRTSRPQRKAVTVEDYLNSLPADKRAQLRALRTAIKKIIPDADEKISYGMPTFFLGRALVGYAAFTGHYSFFPYSSSLIKTMTEDLNGYATSKGTIRIPYGKSLPPAVIKKIVLARVLQNEERDALRIKKKSISTPKKKLPRVRK